MADSRLALCRGSNAGHSVRKSAARPEQRARIRRSGWRRQLATNDETCERDGSAVCSIRCMGRDRGFEGLSSPLGWRMVYDLWRVYGGE